MTLCTSTESSEVLFSYSPEPKPTAREPDLAHDGSSKFLNDWPYKPFMKNQMMPYPMNYAF